MGRWQHPTLLTGPPRSSSWGVLAIVFLRGSHRTVGQASPRPFPSSLHCSPPRPHPRADFSAAGNNEWGVEVEVNCIRAS